MRSAVLQIAMKKERKKERREEGKKRKKDFRDMLIYEILCCKTICHVITIWSCCFLSRKLVL